MNDNKIVAGATGNAEDKAFEEIERKVKENLEVIGQEVQEKIQEIKDKEFIKEQEDIMAEVKEHNDKYNKYIEELEQERQEGLEEMTTHNSKISKNEINALTNAENYMDKAEYYMDKARKELIEGTVSPEGYTGYVLGSYLMLLDAKANIQEYKKALQEEELKKKEEK